MPSRIKSIALTAVVAAAVLVPLYGDPRSIPVTHPEWARMLLRALELSDVVPLGGQASQAFAALSWKNSLAYPADRYARGDGVQVVDEGGVRFVTATGAPGEVAYPLAVVRGGSYRVRVRIKGDPSTPATAEIRRVGDVLPMGEPFSIRPSSISSWVDAGATHLDPGAYYAVVVLPHGTSLEHVEVAPPCVASIEPPGGWKPTAILETGDVAVTTIKAIDKESELPPADTPTEVAGSSFQAAGSVVTMASAGGATGLEEAWLRAGTGGVQAVAFVDLPEAGLYTVSTFGIEGGGQSWLADACQKAVVCASQAAADDKTEPAWRALMTGEFTGGRHFFSVTLGSGAAVGRLRLERKKDSPADYVATLKRLGFDPGPEGTIARNKAVDAMNFIQQRRADLVGRPCGDPTEQEKTLVAGAGPGGQEIRPEVTTVRGPGLPPPFAGPGTSTGGPPVIVSPPPATPVRP